MLVDNLLVLVPEQFGLIIEKFDSGLYLLLINGAYALVQWICLRAQFNRLNGPKRNADSYRYRSVQRNRAGRDSSIARTRLAGCGPFHGSDRVGPRKRQRSTVSRRFHRLEEAYGY